MSYTAWSGNEVFDAVIKSDVINMIEMFIRNILLFFPNPYDVEMKKKTTRIKVFEASSIQRFL